MKKFFHELKGKADTQDRVRPEPSHEVRNGDFPPLSFQEYHRYRYHHGTNIGSIFCLEKWLTPCMFSSGGSCELEAATVTIKELGLEAARQKFEKHWLEYVIDSDLMYLANKASCNAVRLPIGYWTFGSTFSKGTPFEAVASLYVNAWEAVLEMIHNCAQQGIGVLVDLHGLPGGANGNDHSGTNSGRAELWSNKSYQGLAIECLKRIASDLKLANNLIGIQVCNEAESSSADHGLWNFYDRAIAAIRAIDCTIPIYLSDAWRLPSAADEVAKRNSLSSNLNPLILDTHLYFCFSDADKSLSPEQIVSSASNSLSSLPTGEVHTRGAAPVVVGEYSAVMSEPSWSRAPGSERDRLVSDFAQTQARTHQARAAGAFFWTFAMDWPPGGEWGFRAQAKWLAPPWLELEADEVRKIKATAGEKKEGKRKETTEAHARYWDQHGASGDHALHARGWDVGFDDANRMWSMGIEGWRKKGADKIGSTDLWVLKRLREAGDVGSGVWEFEHGLRQGIRDFYLLVGV